MVPPIRTELNISANIVEIINVLSLVFICLSCPILTSKECASGSLYLAGQNIKHGDTFPGLVRPGPVIYRGDTILPRDFKS